MWCHRWWLPYWRWLLRWRLEQREKTYHGRSKRSIARCFISFWPNGIDFTIDFASKLSLCLSGVNFVQLPRSKNYATTRRSTLMGHGYSLISVASMMRTMSSLMRIASGWINSAAAASQTKLSPTLGGQSSTRWVGANCAIELRWQSRPRNTRNSLSLNSCK